MKASIKWITCLAGLALLTGFPAEQSFAQESGNDQAAAGSLQEQAQQTLNTFKQKDPSLEKFFSNSAGYAVFPKVGEGAFIVGGAHGKGMVFQNGAPIGQATVTKGSVGAQIGGQSYAELIFFQTPQALQEFKSGNYQLSAGVSAVAAASGAASQANYSHGVAVFTTAREGVMAQAAIGGQKFTFQPLPGSENAVGGSSTPGGTNSATGDSSTAPK